MKENGRDRADSDEKISGDERQAAEAFMTAAAMSARAGVRLQHGGPFGCSIVRNGVIISCAHNMVLARGDPCCHAEMNAIQQACQALGSHDLSDCDLFTTCEPCPMCWGAVQWARVQKAYIGVNRHTAAKYGFDDKVFYDEVDSKAGHYGFRREGYIKDTSEKLDPQSQRVQKNMLEIYDGICYDECVKSLFRDPAVNRTMRRRFSGGHGDKLERAFQLVFDRETRTFPPPKQPTDHKKFMNQAISVAVRGAKLGKSKEREPFGCIIVKEGVVIAEGCNEVLTARDATATAEVNAIRAATQRLGTYNLSGCEIYCTAHPDLMSLGAILWSRISVAYCGVTQQLAAHCGFEEALLQLQDLIETDAEKRITTVIRDIAVEECEAVFKEWSHRNGVVY
jgi:guanine deaminase